MTSNGHVWGYGEDRSYPMVRAAVAGLARERLALRELSCPPDDPHCSWARAVAECLARGECHGGVLFCADPGLVACVANKVPGLRAVPVTTVGQAARATLTLAANLLVVEMPGRTFFEVRQILRTLVGNGTACPDGVACTLRGSTAMRIAEVIGTVTLSRAHPSLTGARWLIGVPFSLEALKADKPDGEDLVIYDHLGAGLGSRVGFSEGGEAAVAFYPEKKPVDAYCACLLDRVILSET